ncbi:CopD family protein [Halomarina halobia]|uniref:CopD family protein n=1 Tax=Halomarina halobia TaxID=3033386 RepID=A0ABD6AB38_9EURY|nr:CopD family protein [Halomarina sp. PSR21]
MVFPIHLAIRWLHVLSVALLLGGAVLAWVSLRRIGEVERRERYGEYAVAVAAGYERLFWGAAGVAVMTGVGNLGALAPGLPPSDSAWGLALTVKLAGVLGLLLAAVPRTLLVARCDEAAGATGRRVRTLRRGYGATALYLTGVLGLAEVLAHG